MTEIIRTLIVDDEPLARQALQVLLAGESDISIVRECANGDEAVAALGEEEIDLVFLDVQMPGRGGFDVVDAVGETNMPLTVFVTAYDEYALKAFEARALDYLLKPIEDERFATALARARQFLHLARAAETLLHLEDDASPSGTGGWLTFKAYGRLVRLKADDIDWIEAANYCALLHAGAKSYLVRQSLATLQGALDPNRFVRIHRSAIVNVDRIREVQPLQHGDHVVILLDDSRHRLARTRRAALETALGTSI